MYAGDELYDDDVTSGLLPENLTPEQRWGLAKIKDIFRASAEYDARRLQERLGAAGHIHYPDGQPCARQLPTELAEPADEYDSHGMPLSGRPLDADGS